ncbi:MAG: hypothetical protein LUD15_01625 [Bacteroides sp.]|nr:hypothetical protein [Bacteroides sp.]
MAKHHLINAYRNKLNNPVYEEYIKYKEVFATNDTHYQVEYSEFTEKLKKLSEHFPLLNKK